MKLKKLHLYKVEWLDAFSDNSWSSESDIDREIKTIMENPMLCYGLYIKSTSKFHVFTTGVDPGEEKFFNAFCIPKSWIVSIKEVKQ